MKFWIFALLIACCTFVKAGEQSVLVKTEEQPAQPVVTVVPAPAKVCTNCRLYNVEETCDESCRNRLFGGYVKKQVVRKVYRPVRR